MAAVRRPPTVPLLFLLLLLVGGGAPAKTEVDEDDVFDVNESVRRMGDAVFLKNEHVCSGDVEIRMEANFKELSRCTVIEGDLVIATVNMRFSKRSWRFPRLKEITGKFIVYYTNLKRLNMFPNLVVIRGRRPISGYSLVIMDTIFTHIHLPSLRLIQRGGVRVSKNHVMCHVNTVDWSSILEGRNDHELGKDRMSLIMVENNRGICPDLCNESRHCQTGMIYEKKKELCWSPNVCQSICSPTCKNERLACWMNDTKRCCHEECLGGCYGNGTDLCVSCKHFLHDGHCVKACPTGFYEYLERRCISRERCFAKVATDPINYHRNVNYSLHDGKCVPLCPPRYRRNDTTGQCAKCVPNCPKRCGDAWVYGLKESDVFLGCSSVRKLHISIRGGGKAEQLMDRLRHNFRELEVVEEYVKIINTGSLKTLSFLSNLRVIGRGSRNDSEPEPGRAEQGRGRTAKAGGEHNVFEVVANDRLESLWKAKHPVRIYGRVSIHLNRQLCANKILDFLDNEVILMAGNLSAQERTFIQRANGDLMPCNVSTINLTITSVTARNVDVKWAQVDLNDRDLFVTLLMIKPTNKNISLADDRASCETSSWQIHEATTCPKGTDLGGVNGRASLFPRECTLTVTKLTPATRYAVYMESKTTQGDHGAVSPVVYFTTMSEPPTPPRDIVIEALSSNSLKVRWYPPKHPNGRVTTYLIWYRPMKLVKKDFKNRDFCAFKTIVTRHQASRSPSEMRQQSNDAALTRYQNGSVCNTCDECLKFCGNKKPLQQKDELSYSFEDSLQNHIFVKRKVERWDENGDACFLWYLTVKDFLKRCFPEISNANKKLKAAREKEAAAVTATTEKPRTTATLNSRHGNATYFYNSTRASLRNYTPFVTTSEDMRKGEGRSAPVKREREKGGKEAVETTRTPQWMSPPSTVTPATEDVRRAKNASRSAGGATGGQSEWEKMVIVSADTTQYIFTNLQHFTEYIFAIRACQDPPSQQGPAAPQDGLDDLYSTDEDEVLMPGFDNKVCSKMARDTHRTLPNDQADKLDDSLVEINRENGLRVLWSRPKNPNGMILLYWFQFRKVEDDKDDSEVHTKWHRVCVSFRKWEFDYEVLQKYRRQSAGASLSTRSPARRRKRAAGLASPNASEAVATIVASQSGSEIYGAADDAEEEPERGGYHCTRPAFTSGDYEFAIMAVSVAGNGSWSKTFRFHMEGSKAASGNPLVSVVLPTVLIVAAGMLIVVLIIIVVHLRRKTRGGTQELVFPNPEYQKLPQPDEWEIPQDDLVYYNERALGKGHFGVVVKGFVKKLETPAAKYFVKTDSILAAIKMVRKEASFQEKMEFLSEANRMKTFHSHHVVQLLGVVSRMDTRDATPQVVMEFMSHGDLATYLKEIAEKEAISMLAESKMLLWAAQIADGMAYLCSNRVVHRDLAARNCLVDATEVVKIADFGLTRELYYSEDAYKKRRNRGGVIGPFMWMAPESLARGNFSHQSDVWSFGVVLWEIATLGARPYPNMSASAVKDFVLQGNNLLTRDDLWDNSWKKMCPQSVMELMRRCFAFSDKDRPIFSEILLSLEPYFDDRFVECCFYMNHEP